MKLLILLPFCLGFVACIPLEDLCWSDPTCIQKIFRSARQRPGGQAAAAQRITTCPSRIFVPWCIPVLYTCSAISRSTVYGIDVINNQIDAKYHQMAFQSVLIHLEGIIAGQTKLMQIYRTLSV